METENHCQSSNQHLLIIEPFYGGSHKALIDTITKHIPDCTLITLPPKKWHWRARCAPLMLLPLIPKVTTQKVLFCTSVLSLAELLGIRPDLQQLKKIVYFHENQLMYPVQEIKDRDCQYCYNQVMTCLAADLVLFNSNYNMRSLLDNIEKILKLMPDCRPKNLKALLENKCRVLYFPVKFPPLADMRQNAVLHIVWPHRWEFDKGPEDFFKVLFRLKENNFKFEISILGESFTEKPPIFQEARSRLKEEILNFGFLSSKEAYYEILYSSHVVVSTSKHEFFGVAMLEAAYCGCYPIAPNALVYPEIYPKECLFSSLDELYVKLKELCLRPALAVEKRQNLKVDFNQYSCDYLVPQYLELLK